MYKELKQQVFESNMELVKKNLIIYTWGNVSGIDREKGVIAIKPSGMDYEKMKADDMVVLDLDGKQLDGNLKPSSDTPTHLELYRNFPHIGGIVHTHSVWATSWAQAGRGIPAFGTTHADYFHGEIPCTPFMNRQEVEGEYELETGKLIVKEFLHLDPIAVPAVLVAGHGPFTWGKDAPDAVHNAVVLEVVAQMAFQTLQLGNSKPIEEFILNKHYFRKHGKDSYYGQ